MEIFCGFFLEKKDPRNISDSLIANDNVLIDFMVRNSWTLYYLYYLIDIVLFVLPD
jgi:hypothetical protein